MTKEEAKHLSEVLKAYSEGKTIQWKDKVGNNVWYYMTSNCTMLDIYNKCYRIKPEPKTRPYKNADEFLKAQKEHGSYLGLVYRREEDDLFIPARVNSLGIMWVTMTGDWKFYNYNDLSLNYTWQDGHPCGIVEEQL